MQKVQKVAAKGMALGMDVEGCTSVKRAGEVGRPPALSPRVTSLDSASLPLEDWRLVS